MAWISPYIGDLPRQEKFPLRVCSVFHCENTCFHSPPEGRTCNFFEVSIRLHSEAPQCNDLINGKPMGISFPNTVFKKTGMKIALAGEHPRDSLAFAFKEEQMELLRNWGLIPEEDFWEIHLSEELNRLIIRLRHLMTCYTLDGMIDQLDWVCLQIIRELVFQRRPPLAENMPESRIKEAALYMLRHYDREVVCDEVAARFGFSHAAFFREWKRHFDISPKGYLLEFRLQAAAREIIQSDLPVSHIVKMVHFSGVTAFHRKFKERFGATPDQFRKEREFWVKKLPSLELHIH